MYRNIFPALSLNAISIDGEGVLAMSEARQHALSSIRQRVCDTLTVTLPDADCLAVSLACSAVRDREEVLGVLLSNFHLKAAVRNMETLAISDKEWEILFGAGVALLEGSVSDISKNKDFGAIIADLQGALRCSLIEYTAKDRWSWSSTKVACYVALHAEAAEERVAYCLGGLVSADSRRLDDVRSVIEDQGADYLLLSQSVISLAKAVV